MALLNEAAMAGYSPTLQLPSVSTNLFGLNLDLGGSVDPMSLFKPAVWDASAQNKVPSPTLTDVLILLTDGVSLSY